MLTRTDRKKFPKLEKLMGRKRAVRRTPQTPEQMRAVAAMITAAFGGTVAPKKG